jgi:hypothetical protein
MSEIKLIVKLTKPITAHGETVDEITLREPTVEEVMEEGYPFLLVQARSGDHGVEIRLKVIARYVMRLAGIPMSSVKQLSLSDLKRCQTEVMSFFGEEDEVPKSSPSPSSTSRISGD